MLANASRVAAEQSQLTFVDHQPVHVAQEGQAFTRGGRSVQHDLHTVLACNTGKCTERGQRGLQLQQQVRNAAEWWQVMCRQVGIGAWYDSDGVFAVARHTDEGGSRRLRAAFYGNGVNTGRLERGFDGQREAVLTECTQKLGCDASGPRAGNCLVSALSTREVAVTTSHDGLPSGRDVWRLHDEIEIGGARNKYHSSPWQKRYWCFP